MTTRWMIGLAASGLMGLNVAMADSEPLSRESLARCASQVQTLRDESTRLTRESTALDRRREGIEERSAQLRLERENPVQDDLEAGLDFRQRQIEHKAQTVAFNADIQTLRDQITALNALKFDYEQRCAKRAYRRADLESLSSEDQSAMREGLGDVKVPYIDPASTPPPQSQP